MKKELHPNRLRVILAERQITNRWLAGQLGKSEMTISRWTTNKAQPSLNQLIEMAKLLNVEIGDFVKIRNSQNELYMLRVSDIVENYTLSLIHISEPTRH